MVDHSYLRVYQGRRVLVTGHTGFKGAWLTYLLAKAGAEIVGISIDDGIENGIFKALDLQRSVTHIKCDIRDFPKLQSVFTKYSPEFVFHMAAQALVLESYQDPRATFEINVQGSVNILEAVRQSKAVRSLVYVTSDKCYENKEWVWGYRESDRVGGHDPYSASKGAAEIIFSSYLRSFLQDSPRLAAASVRAGNVVGGGDWAVNRIIPDCIRACLLNTPISVRSPKSRRPWQHVLEPISGYLKLGSALFSHGNVYNGAWNFGPGIDNVKTVLEVANRVASAFGNTVIVTKDVNAPYESKLLYLSSDKANQVLGWKARWRFDQSISETIEWYRRVVIDGSKAQEVTDSQVRRYYNGYFD
jgi:CDP-glucose 4,6-dehydratase